MSVIDRVSEIFPSRFTPYPYQGEIILKAIQDPGSLLKMDVGTGKTIVSWFMALGSTLDTDISQILILCPPTLVRQWYRFVLEFENIPSVCAYQGTPSQRKQMDLTESIVIMGYQIFIRDWKKIYHQLQDRNVYVIADEVSLRSIKTQTYKKIRELLYNAGTSRLLNSRDNPEPDKPFTFLNATPISNPAQTYNYIKLLTPRVYRSLKQFEDLHVEAKDVYKKACKFKNMDLLEENFKLRRYDAIADELLDLPEITYIPIRYDLSDKHMQMYNKLSNSEVNAFPDCDFGNVTKIDGLFIKLQQMITNPDMFGFDYPPMYLELLDERLEELGDDEKVIIYGHFKPTNRRILQHLEQKAVGYWSDFTSVQKEKNEDAFRAHIHRLVAHCKSGGVGLNLQFARHEIFVEIPPDPPSFKQAVGRIYRDGQTRKCFITVFLAAGTIQERIYDNLIFKDMLLADVVGDRQSLKDFLF